MNVRFLIDRLVRHQAVLLAELATSGGARAPLAELLDQTFIHMAEELDRRGVSRKVSADMFGMAQRAYLKKIQRLAESSTDKGTSLWEAVLRFVSEREEAKRAEILQRFSHDDEAQVRAVLFDLVESGLFVAEGTGPAGVFRVQTLEASRLGASENFAELLWLYIFREGPVRRSELLLCGASRSNELDKTLDELLSSGRIEGRGEGDQTSYSSPDFVRPVGHDASWEAAVLDHYQALVATIRAVLSKQASSEAPASEARPVRRSSRPLVQPRSLPEESPPAVCVDSPPPSSVEPEAGGFTYAFDVWPEHPLHDEVVETLARLRADLSALRKRVDETNQHRGRPPTYREVTVYGGQSTKERATVS